MAIPPGPTREGRKNLPVLGIDGADRGPREGPGNCVVDGADMPLDCAWEHLQLPKALPVRPAPKPGEPRQGAPAVPGSPEGAGHGLRSGPKARQARRSAKSRTAAARFREPPRRACIPIAEERTMALPARGAPELPDAISARGPVAVSLS